MAVLLYLIWVFCLGWVSVSVLHRDRLPLAALLGRGLMLGLGGQAFSVFLAVLCGLSASRAVCLALLGLAIAAAGVFAWRGRLAMPEARPTAEGRGWLALGLAAMCVLAVVLVTLAAMTSKAYEWDVWAMWGFKAKVLTRESLWSGHYFRWLPYAYSQLDYPLLVPSQMASVYGLAGSFDELQVKIPFVVGYIALLLVAYDLLGRRLPRLLALGATAMLAWTPSLLEWAGTGYCDTTLALFMLAVTGYTAEWLRRGRTSDLALAAAAAAFGAFTKNEGLAFIAVAAIAAVFTLAPMRDWKRLARVAAGIGVALLALAPFFLWRLATPDHFESYPRRLTSAHLVEGIGRLPTILRYLAGTHLLGFGAWGGAWLLPLAGLLLHPRALANAGTRFVWLCFGGQLALYIVIYMVSPNDLASHLSNSSGRLLLHLLPLAFLLLAEHAAVTRGCGASVRGGTAAGMPASTAIPAPPTGAGDA